MWFPWWSLFAALASATVAPGPALDARQTDGWKATRAETPVREWRDEATGRFWRLMRGRNGGPGRLVLAGEAGEPVQRPMVVHAGDQVLVEQHTAVADLNLRAVALGGARVGERFRARFSAGGAEVWLQAVEPGRAAFVLPSAPQAALGGNGGAR